MSATSAFGNLSLEATQLAVLAELGQKLEAGQTVVIADGGGSITVDGPLTDAQLRALAVAISGTVALDAATLAALETINVIGPLTDTQLRATPVPVSGTVTTAGLTDTQLRAAPVPVSGTITANLGTIDGAATEATLLATRNRLPSAVTATDELPVADDYQEFEALADQAGAGAVLTFTFTAPVQLVVVHAVGTALVARATTTQTPSATLGARCADDAPAYLPVTTSSVKVFAPLGMTVSVIGYRRS